MVSIRFLPIYSTLRRPEKKIDNRQSKIDNRKSREKTNQKTIGGYSMYAGIGRWSSASGSRRSQKVVMYLLETCASPV